MGQAISYHQTLVIDRVRNKALALWDEARKAEDPYEVLVLAITQAHRDGFNAGIEEAAKVAEKVADGGLNLHQKIGNSKEGWGLSAGQATAGFVIANAIRSIRKEGA